MNMLLPVSSQFRFQFNPFDLNDDVAYQFWREEKLAHYPTSVNDLVVEIANPFALTNSEREGLLNACTRANMAVYRIRADNIADKEIPRAIAKQVGMTRLDYHQCVDEDGISPIQVTDQSERHDYIPYTNKPINWHTDGYYNTPDHTICGMVLHCVRPALHGGDNGVIDHEMIYALLRDENPDYISVLMQPDVMTIPENVQNGVCIRPEQTGPVFSLVPGTGQLHMRYTARGHNIVWKNQPLVSEAVQRLRALMEPTNPYVFTLKLQAGDGLICNNVLHRRTAFVDSPNPNEQRLLYRARYYDRISR